MCIMQFYVHEYDNPNILPTDRDWDFPREKVRMYDILSESHEGFLIKAEAEDIIPGNPGITLVAVKTLKATASDMQKYMMMRELELMKSLPPHPNVLQLLGVCIEKEPILMIVETCGLGNLQDYLTYVKDRNLHLNIAGHNNFTLTKEILTFGSQIARGMHYLASFSVLHRDLAARNIYIGEGRICKVSHFGFARDVIENYQYERTAQARLPVRWMAPESLLNNVYTVKSNVWSFGVLLWEMASLGATPYPNQTVSQVTRSIKRGQKLECPPHCGDELYTIMKRCWKQKPYERPDFETLRKDLEDLADNSKEYIQLEKYPENVYVRLAKTEDEIV